MLRFCSSEALCEKIKIFSTPNFFFTELAEKFRHALATHWLAALLPGACRQGGGDERSAGEGRQGRPQGWDGSHTRPPSRPLRALLVTQVFLSFFILLESSVADPDPYNFGPPGSESISQRCGSGSFYHQARIVRKTLIPTVLWLFIDFFIFEKGCKCTFKKSQINIVAKFSAKLRSFMAFSRIKQKRRDSGMQVTRRLWACSWRGRWQTWRTWRGEPRSCGRRPPATSPTYPSSPGMEGDIVR